ncbi:MAG: T9SS type A sorting domain-containing protein [Bacteroidetes bacterium]|nr:T9SS type A sorting domain-containing protein [Bacteroidota bacterium]
MKTPKTFFLVLMFAANGVVYGQPMASKTYNFDTFTLSGQEITEELKRLTPAEFQTHPEFGTLPYNAPCQDCYELIHERTDSTRMFVGKGAESTLFYSQAAYGKIHYTDSDGYLRTYDPRIKPLYESSTVFESSHQDFPIRIDSDQHLTSFTLPGGEQIALNRNIELVHKSTAGTFTSLGQADWSNITAGDDGIKISNAWPGIDIEIKVSLGQLKTDYVVTSNPGFSDGHLIFTDHLAADSEFHLEMHEVIDIEAGTGAKIGVAKIVNTSGDGLYFETAFGYDQSGIKENTDQFGYKIQDHDLEMWVPVEWLNNPAAVYPMVIDPSVNSSATYTAGIMRFRYNGSFCGGTGVDCSYTLTVPRPANSTLTGATFSIVHETLGGSCFFSCWMSDAGFYFQTSCGVDGYWGCNADAPGTCTGTNLAFDNLVTCLAPACSGNVNFSIFNSYCYCNTGGACGTSCQRINNNTWIVTITGSTLETLANTATGNGSQTINDADCIGTSILDPATANGVPGYTYAWSTGATSSTITVNNTPAVYTCTVTDACGVSRIATFDIGCPLPVRLDNLIATTGENNIKVSWNTFTESGMEKFVVQRLSADGSFKDLTTIPAQGGDAGYAYEVPDTKPLPGINYYRLLVYYESGEPEATETVGAFFDAAQKIEIIPNPNAGSFEIRFTCEVGAESVIEVLDLTGKPVFTKNLVYSAENVTQQLDLTYLTSGIYTLRVKSGNQILSERLVIR